MGAALLLWALGACPGCQDGGTPLLTRVADVELPGRPTRLDYQAVDGPRGRLVLTHLGDNEVLVVRLSDGAVVRRLPGIPVPRGVALAGGGARLLVTSAPDRLVVLDAATLEELGRVPAGRAPDGVAADPVHHVAAVSAQGDGAVVLLAADGLGAARAVKLGTETGNVVFDARRGRFWVTVVPASPPDLLVGLDPVTGEVLERVALPGCAGAHGLALHPDGESAYVACEDGDRLVRAGLGAGHPLAQAEVPGTPDVLALDPGLGRLYVAAERGDLTVVDLAAPGVRVLGRVPVGPDAHTVAVDPATHRVYLPLKAGPSGRPVLRVLRPGP